MSRVGKSVITLPEGVKVEKTDSTLIVNGPKGKLHVNLFGGILRCDVAARGIVQASKETTVPPIIVRMLGTNADEGSQILLDSSLDVKLIHDLHDAREEFLQS